MEVDFFSYLTLDYHLRGKVHVTLYSALSVLTHAQVCLHYLVSSATLFNGRIDCTCECVVLSRIGSLMEI